MTPSSSGDDPVVRALDELVRAGQIPPERARAAYEGSLRRPGRPLHEPTAPTEPEPDRQLRLETIVIAAGVGLFAATIGVASAFARERSDLDWSNFLLGALAAVALLACAGAALVVVRDDVRKRNLVAWPGAVGAVGIGTMLAVLLDDNPATGYLAGALTAALAAGGYYLVRRGAFVVAAILGLLAVYTALFDDIVDLNDTQGDSTALAISAAVMVFTIGITAAGWLLPTRDLSGVFVGAFAVVAYAILLLAVMVIASFERALGATVSTDLGSMGSRPPQDLDRFNDDIYLTLLFAAILVAGWAVCSVLTGHVGYRVLMLLMIATVVPLSVAALAPEHPSWWSLGAGVAGAVLLALAGLRALGVIGDYGRRPPLRPSGGRPINLDEPR